MKPAGEEAGAVSPSLRNERLCLSAVFFALGIVWAAWAGRIPQLQERLAITDGQLGLSMFCLALGSIVSMPASAALGARFGTARMTSIFSVLFPTALLLVPVAPTWPLFSAALFWYGFTMGGQDVSMNAHAVQVERDHNRPIMSSFHGTYSVGAMCGGAVSALMCRLAVLPLVHYALVAVVVAPAMLFVSRHLSAAPEDGAHDESPVFVLPDRHIFVLSLVAFCAFIGEGAISDWSAVYLDHELHSGASLAATGFSIFCLAMAIFRFAGDTVVHRLGHKRVLFLAGLTSAAGVALSLLLTNPIAVLATYLIVGAGFSVMVPVAFSTAGMNRELKASVAIAGVATTGYLGFIIAPPIIGFLADHVTLRVALWSVVVLSLLVSVLSPKVMAGASGR